MKDLPHHMKQLNRRIVRSIRREMLEDEEYEAKLPSPPAPTRSKQAQKKIAKQKIKTAKKARAPIHPSQEERNQKMKHRAPIFDRNSAKPRGAKATKKRTPRI